MKFSPVAKILFTSVLAISTSAAMAGHHKANHVAAASYKGDYKNEMVCPRLPSLADGFYVGAQVGYDAFRIRQTLSGGGTFSAVGSLTGWEGGLFVGYGRYLTDLFYLGGELLGNYNGSSQTVLSMADNDGDAASGKLKAKGTWGLSLLPGIKINQETLGYLRLGYDWTNFQANGSVTSSSVTSSYSKSKTQGGWDMGLGLETLICDNWSVRTEYNHIWYSSFSTSTPLGSANTSPSDNQFNVGLVYHIM
ncbi:MAG TPA: outer membrane beta-barrel protein [Gammaproteobacteria bacterium]|jgi:opacity protein-like surface antigen|nr:outer membrane beta-barrel protein [Gammaproteobacteria bacterium]